MVCHGSFLAPMFVDQVVLLRAGAAVAPWNLEGVFGVKTAFEQPLNGSVMAAFGERVS